MFMRRSDRENAPDGEFIDKLLASVKKEVKQLMEEAVTKKFIHEDSGSVTALCGAVETCLKYKLKKQTMGLFKDSFSTTALLHKVAKYLNEAKEIARLVTEDETQNDPLSRFSLRNLMQDSEKPSGSRCNGYSKYGWIRIALFNKVLAVIISFLANNSGKFYEPTSLFSDQANGSLLAQLLEGPCALEYTRLKTSDHLFTDPHAKELVLRSRLHSGSSSNSQVNTSFCKRPALGLKSPRNNTSSSSEESVRSVPPHAREYVDSLHQNYKCTLLYGKNNVKVLPRGCDGLMPGYLSLHQSCEGLRLKWTPNELIGKTKSEDKLNVLEGIRADENKNNCPKEAKENPRQFSRKQLFWDCAINIDFNEIVYLHCHHEVDCGGRLILVGIDGVQSPSFHFPYGGHLLAFLTCLESGLHPCAHLDPPLWIHKDTGKVFPKIKRKLSKTSLVQGRPELSAEDNIDYVFRILTTVKPTLLHEFVDEKTLSILNFEKLRSFKLPWSNTDDTSSLTQSIDSLSDSFNGSLSRQSSIDFAEEVQRPALQTRDSLQKLCETMRHKILSRAFFGWLAHCRHLKTVREHLSGLVFSGEVVEPTPPENEKSLTVEFWTSLSERDQILRQSEIYKRIYYGGMSHDLRKHVWPYLLSYYQFGSCKAERMKVEMTASKIYEDTKAEWMAVEAYIKQRICEDSPDDDLMDAVISEQENKVKSPLHRRESSLSNEVFLETVVLPDEQPMAPRKNLQRWHTVESGYREDFCSVKMSLSYPGYFENGFHEEPSKIPLEPRTKTHNDLIVEQFSLNLLRIDKDVHRCDRNYWYFTENNLKKLRNVMCTYVWKNLEVGYVQGMCDLVAPLLVVFDDESITYSCFSELMKRMVDNFPNGQAMDKHLSNMRSLIRVLDSELFELIQHNGDYTHFFFCYRWLLLDFKRELCYEDVFLVWESIWAARHMCSENYVVFIALAMIETYRDIILDNSMDFIDVMKFFNEMAEKHNAREVLHISRQLVYRLQNLIEKK